MNLQNYRERVAAKLDERIAEELKKLRKLNKIYAAQFMDGVGGVNALSPDIVGMMAVENNGRIDSLEFARDTLDEVFKEMTATKPKEGDKDGDEDPSSSGEQDGGLYGS